jgi:hypothetical protein
MFVYATTKASQEATGTLQQGIFQTSATPNATSNNARFLTVAARPCYIQAFYVTGKGAALTSISGISIRVIRWTSTASTGGTAMTPRPRDFNSPAASTTAFSDTSAITSGTGGPAMQVQFGCGAAGPGGWVAPNPDSALYLPAGGGAATGAHCDILSHSGTASLFFDLEVEHFE